jgi:hypothetical protein
MSISAEDIDGFDDAVRSYLENCDLSLEVESDYYNSNELKLTVKLLSPSAFTWRGTILIEDSVTFEVGDKNND